MTRLSSLGCGHASPVGAAVRVADALIEQTVSSGAIIGAAAKKRARAIEYARLVD